MPLNVRRIYTSVLLVLFGSVLFSHAQQQAVPTQTTVPAQLQATVPTSGDVMRERIARAKAFIAVRNYNAAIYELENIRKESNDAELQAGVNVLLMNSYLEQGDYKRAQDFLSQFYATQKTSKPNASAFYMAVAGQVVKGARNRVERYRALGLSISDRTLPLEATNDLEKMRETLELVITQAKDIGKEKAKTPNAMALLEEASSSRSMLARDDYDARRWRDEVADTREAITNSRSVVLDANSGAPQQPQEGEFVAVAKTEERPPVSQPVVDIKNNVPADGSGGGPLQKTPPESTLSQNNAPIYVPSAPPTVQPSVKEELKAEPKTPNTQPVTSTTPIDVGSLVAYATNQPSPVYPRAAKSLGAKGVVRVDVTVNETGDVSEVQKTSGPSLLQGAAKDAIKKWKFKPFIRDGQPVKANGFVSFNFDL
jgi:TonB family protein